MENRERILQSSEIKQDLITFFKNKSLIPIVGSGISCGVPTIRGCIPSGKEYKEHMLKTLQENPQFTREEQMQLEREIFSTLCEYYEDDENVSPEYRSEYLKDHFFHAKYPEDDIRRRFFEIGWPYIYSLNIDDAIENSTTFKTTILPNREINEDVFNENPCLIKLHGDIRDIITYHKSEKVFTSSEYALSLTKNAALLSKLKNDYAYQNILYIGCSLDDEVDLKTLNNSAIDFQLKDTLSRTIIFVKGKPNKLQRSKYKTYGITDIVCFDDYNSMYSFIFDVWKESLQITDEELEQYSNVSFSYIRADEIESNRNYYFWGKGLLNLKEKKITYPYYFIKRDITDKIIEGFGNGAIHLVYGRRVSGKSYLLADIYKNIRDREVIFLDGKSRLSREAFQHLILCQNSLVLLDIGAISRDQLGNLLLCAESIYKNNSNFVICINENDSDTKGVIRSKIIQNRSIDGFILRNTLNNKFEEKTEMQRVNKLLPPINLPQFSNRNTLLDQLISAERLLRVKGQYANMSLKINSTRQLALFIILAIHESIYSTDIVNFGLDQEIVDASRRYSPFIERIETSVFEKEPSDLASIKYTLNSKYWLRRELGEFARDNNNYDRIAEAFRYIVQRVMERWDGNEYQQRRHYREYIMFDVMNDVFLDEYGGNLKLNLYIYSQLHSSLAGDYNFLHQEAKCYTNYAYSLKSTEDKKENLRVAREFALLSLSMISQRNEYSQSESLVISEAHVQYTIATIICDQCKIAQYADGLLLHEAIEAVCGALYSPYNNDDYHREHRRHASQGITNFIHYVSSHLDELEVGESDCSRISSLLNYLISQKAVAGD